MSKYIRLSVRKWSLDVNHTVFVMSNDKKSVKRRLAAKVGLTYIKRRKVKKRHNRKQKIVFYRHLEFYDG